MTDEMETENSPDLELKRLDETENRVEKIENQAENLSHVAETADGLIGGMETAMKGLEVVGEVAGLASNFLGHRKFLKSHLPVNYLPATENWRWSPFSPALDLPLKDEPESSLLACQPGALRSKQFFPSLAGFGSNGLWGIPHRTHIDRAQ